MCLLRPMCPVMMHIPVRYLVRSLRLFVSTLRVFVWWLPSIRSVCACLLEFHLLWVRLLTLSLIVFLMWLSRTRLHTKLLLTVPALASSSAFFSLPQCPVWAFIHLRCTVFSSASLVRALWHSLMDLLLCILLERAWSADRLSLQIPEGYLLVVEVDELFCSMLDGCCFGLEDSTVVFHFEGMLCDGFWTCVGYNKPATCTMFSFWSVCKAANAMGTCFYDVRVESVFVVLCE